MWIDDSLGAQRQQREYVDGRYKLNKYCIRLPSQIECKYITHKNDSCSGGVAVRGAGGAAVDVTVGSALDCFGGALPYDEVVDWHNAQKSLVV